MKRDTKLYLQDIVDCINKIQKYVRGLSIGQFEEDDLTQDAVPRRILIIGEATKNIPQV